MPRIANTAIRKRKQQEREETTGKRGEGQRNREGRREEVNSDKRSEGRKTATAEGRRRGGAEGEGQEVKPPQNMAERFKVTVAE